MLLQIKKYDAMSRRGNCQTPLTPLTVGEAITPDTPEEFKRAQARRDLRLLLLGAPGAFVLKRRKHG